MQNKKVCKRGLNDIWINEYDGKVRICGWSNYYIGSLTENTIEEIWHGELAQKFRDSMLDASYSYCNHSKCPYCANGNLQDMLVDYTVPDLPKFCSLSYQLQCNYSCKFCRTEHYIPCDCERDNYKKIEKEIKKILPSLDTLSSNGAGEFFCSDSILRLLNTEELNPDTHIAIETNGSLFNEANWNKIKNLGEHYLEVAITVHSFDEQTYRYLSGTDISVKQVMNNLLFVSELRRKGIINKFEIATVICERNFREMPEFVKTCLNNYEMDTVRLRFFEPYGVMDPMTEWFYDVRNEYHPYYDEFQKVMSSPIFEHPKVWKWQGNTKSLQQESPYVLEKRRGDSLARLILLQDANEKLVKYFEKQSVNRIALFGAANMGMAFHKLFNSYGIQISTIFDSYALPTSTEEICVCKPSEDLIGQFDMILITTDTFASQIREILERIKYTGKVMTISDMINDIEGID